jgi:hypothetical protein
VAVNVTDPLPLQGPASGLEAVAFPETVSAGGVYPQGGAPTATVVHSYPFAPGDTAEGSYAITATDRAGNASQATWQMTRDALAPTVAFTVPARLTGTAQVGPSDG